MEENGLDQKPNFTIRDRRARHDEPGQEDSSAQSDAVGTDAPASQEAAGAQAESPQASIPREITFQSFVYSLASSAVTFMGEGAPQEGSSPHPDLAHAREMIDILSMLEEKTKGNRTPEEDKLLKDMLYTLRLTFVQRASGKR